MSDKNPYLDLMDDDEPKRKPSPKHAEKPQEKTVLSEDVSAPMIAPDWATTHDGVPVKEDVAQEPVDKNPYSDLFDEGDDHQNEMLYGAAPAAGTAASSLSKGSPSLAELLTGAPSGSVGEIKALMNPSKPVMTPAVAAQAAAEARIPGVAPVPPAPVEKAIPQSGGQKWLENYAGMERPEFTGGVPEAAQTYQRSKPQGKITSQLYKKFGSKPLNIAGQAAQTALSEDEALMRVRQALYEHQMHQTATVKAQQAAAERAAVVEKQAQAAANASKLSKIMSALGKGVAGAGAGLGAYDAYRRFHEGDTHGATVGALGTAAGLAPLAMGSAGILPALGAAAPLYLMAHDRIERLKEHPEEVRLQEDNFDPMGNRIR